MTFFPYGSRRSIEIQSGAFHTCAIVNGAAQYWGLNFFGEIGNATNSATMNPNNSPLTVTGLGSGAQEISMGSQNSVTYAVVNGGIQIWGSNEFEQLATSTNVGTTNANSTPLGPLPF